MKILNISTLLVLFVTTALGMESPFEPDVASVRTHGREDNSAERSEQRQAGSSEPHQFVISLDERMHALEKQVAGLNETVGTLAQILVLNAQLIPPVQPQKQLVAQFQQPAAPSRKGSQFLNLYQQLLLHKLLLPKEPNYLNRLLELS